MQMTLVNGYRSHGEYNVTLNGSQLSSGVYFCKLKVGGFVIVRKMMLVK